MNSLIRRSHYNINDLSILVILQDPVQLVFMKFTKESFFELPKKIILPVGWVLITLYSITLI